MSNLTEIEQQKTASCLKTGKALIQIISDIINNEKSSLPEDTDFEKILRLSFAHRISGFVAYGVKNYCEDAGILKKFEAELFKAAARHTAQEREVRELSDEFSKAEIQHCFLKGMKISSLYDVPEMRFMLDIDVYVVPDKFEKAIEVMKSRDYSEISVDDKDCSLSKKPFLNVDLHRELKYDFDLGYEFYKNVDERLIDVEGSFERTMTNEELYVYLLSHTAHHFATAGTGIKSVIDHYYILKSLLPKCDDMLLEQYLNQSGLKKFNETFTKLCKVWFMGEDSDETTEKMSDYIILSGAYGTDINYYVNSVLRMGVNDVKSYYFKRLFPEYKTMCYRYPVLKRHKLLLPLFWIIRIFQSLASIGRIKGEASGMAGVESENTEKQNTFLENVGL